MLSTFLTVHACLYRISSRLLHFPWLHTVHISKLIPEPSSMFSFLCISIRASSLTFKAGNVIFLSQLWCRNSGESFWYLPPRLTPVVLASYNRLCHQTTPGSPDDFPYPSRPGSSVSLCRGKMAHLLLQLLLHQLITASGSQLYRQQWFRWLQQGWNRVKSGEVSTNRIHLSILSCWTQWQLKPNIARLDSWL